MKKDEKKERKSAKNLEEMRAQGWDSDKDYICMIMLRKGRLVYGWTNREYDCVYCPYHKNMFTESGGHFQIKKIKTA